MILQSLSKCFNVGVAALDVSCTCAQHATHIQFNTVIHTDWLTVNGGKCNKQYRKYASKEGMKETRLGDQEN